MAETAREAFEKSKNDPNFTGRTRCIVHCMRGRSRSASKRLFDSRIITISNCDCVSDEV